MICDVMRMCCNVIGVEQCVFVEISLFLCLLLCSGVDVSQWSVSGVGVVRSGVGVVSQGGVGVVCWCGVSVVCWGGVCVDWCSV